MTANLTLIVVAGALIAAGTYLLTERAMTRILLGVLLSSNGVSVLFLVAAGAAGSAPILGDGGAEKGGMSDPLPQAMVLTAIVITLGTVAFLLTMAYRSFQLNGHDEVQDDVEDARIRRLAEQDEASDSYDEGGTELTDEEGRIVESEGQEE
ncbi:Na(+)/H(+) antiporter subunit C [Microlunatus soli]|uniref:Multisubunit sodium/proton antiporter, MrpC subunit n=1 Tax=Microlunatus soli TaxID=630515 RepID=A0A1H1Y9C8_9ACTN|nr:Na(+)/H(+) antiporter subunit C [Microlunatus soli]SDT17964.1 multisubunit sodium/proton antiporter, MrpC subunit [Microlunatus soli]